MARKTKEEMIVPTKNDVKQVTTFDGRLVPRENCKRIDGEYYEVNVDCFLVKNEKGESKWTRRNTGRIAFNCESQTWELTKKLRELPNYVEGIYSENGDKGYFVVNPYKNVVLTEKHTDTENEGVICLSKDIAEKLGYMEDFGTGCYINSKNLSTSAKRVIKKKDIRGYPGIKKLAYNADDNNSFFLKIIKEYSKHKSNIVLGEMTTQAAKLLGNLSYGLEIETCNGYLPPNLLGPLGIVPLKDGSLRDENGREPYEYTTVPLTGEIGLETIKLQFEELNKRCEINQKCSLHIHIGGISKRSPEFVVALYKLAYNIQDEIFQMFPDYKSYPEKYGLHKNYCNKLPDLGLNNIKFNKNNITPSEGKRLIKKGFDLVYWWASDQTISGTNSEWNLDTRSHPKGNMEKWNYHARYSWLNFHNFIFSKRDTLEFRVHTPTLNFVKASNWLFITSAIIQFTEQFTNEILRDEVSCDLKTILSCYKNYFFKSFYENDYSNRVANYLIDYVEFRKEQMKKCIENGDGWGTLIEFDKDSNFKFQSQGLNSIY